MLSKRQKTKSDQDTSSVAVVHGFITGTFDLLHEDHIRLLKSCKARCDFLTVGLVTDALAIRQKRQTLLSFQHRRVQMESLKWVDEVVEHIGDSKLVAWQKLKFNVLFASDEFYKSKEFEAFPDKELGVTVIYMPKNYSISSTSIVEQLMKRFQESEKILCMSISGCITRHGFSPYVVSKKLHFAREECVSNDTSDVFGFYKFPQLPRNWKRPQADGETPVEPEYPMISGINTQREIAVNEHLKGRSYCTYLYSNVVHVKDNAYAPATDMTSNDTLQQAINNQSLNEFAKYVSNARLFPHKIVSLVQIDAGVTLEYWAQNLCQDREHFDSIVYKIETIIEELEKEGITHYDIHARNVLVSKDEQVFLIDFGWSVMRSFQLCEKERAALNEMIATHFDLRHFRESLKICSATRKWLK